MTKINKKEFTKADLKRAWEDGRQQQSGMYFRFIKNVNTPNWSFEDFFKEKYCDKISKHKKERGL